MAYISTLESLDDVEIISPSERQFLSFNGLKWVNLALKSLTASSCLFTESGQPYDPGLNDDIIGFYHLGFENLSAPDEGGKLLFYDIIHSRPNDFEGLSWLNLGTGLYISDGALNIDVLALYDIGGDNTQVQYNKEGDLAGDADFTWDDSGKSLFAKYITSDSINVAVGLDTLYLNPTSISMNFTYNPGTHRNFVVNNFMELIDSKPYYRLSYTDGAENRILTAHYTDGIGHIILGDDNGDAPDQYLDFYANGQLCMTVNNPAYPNCIRIFTDVSLPDNKIYAFGGDSDYWNSKEDFLGLPADDGYILSSTTTGDRTWIASPDCIEDGTYINQIAKWDGTQWIHSRALVSDDYYDGPNASFVQITPEIITPSAITGAIRSIRIGNLSGVYNNLYSGFQIRDDEAASNYFHESRITLNLRNTDTTNIQVLDIHQRRGLPITYTFGGFGGAAGLMRLDTYGNATLDNTAYLSSIDPGAGITVTGNTVSLTSGVCTTGTYNSVTVDTYGRVTAGTNTTLPFDSGTAAGQMLYWTGLKWTYAVTSDLFYDVTNHRIGIGTNTPLYTVHVLATTNIGIMGISGTTTGVYGMSTSGAGIVGASGSGKGGNFVSTSGYGIYSTSTSNYGIYGTSTSNIAIVGNSASNIGVYGSGNYGVYGITSSGTAGTYGTCQSTIAVYGRAETSGIGGKFFSTTGTGLYAYTTSGYAGIFMGGNVGIKTATPGYELTVTGQIGANTVSSTAITGTSSGTGIGVNGVSGTGYGVYGNITGASGYGVYGTTPAGYAIYGISTTGYGLYGTSSSGTAIYGTTTSGYSGIFMGGKVGVLTATPVTDFQVYGNTKLGKGTQSVTKTISIAGNTQYDIVANPTTGETSGIILTNGGAGNIAAGTYYYAIAYTTAEGETSGSTYSSFPSITLAVPSSVNLTNIPISSDVRVTGRNIYRSQAGTVGDIYYLYKIGTIANNTTTTFADNTVVATTASDWIYNKNNTTAGVTYIGSNKIIQTTQYITSVGYGAFNSLTRGSATAAFGSNCLSAVTIGDANQAFGHNSGATITSGTENNLFGYASGQGNQTGSYNCAFGNNSLRNELTNSYTGNSAFGSTSLQNLVTSNNYNSAFGYQSGKGSQGAGGIYIGYNAGYKATPATVGASNIVIGYDAGKTLGSGAGNILLGRSIELTNPTTSNQLNIGNLIFATSMDGTGTTISTGNVGIGTVAPTAKLQITRTGDVGASQVIIESDRSSGATRGIAQFTLKSISDGSYSQFLHRWNGTERELLITTYTGAAFLEPFRFNLDTKLLKLGTYIGITVDTGALNLTGTTGIMTLNRLTTTERDALTAVNGMVIYNSTTNKFQGYENGSWQNLI